MAVVTLENAGRTYDGRPVLEGVTLTVPKGSCLALIGHNGAGKTTLMKLILGLARPTSGSVSVLGVDPANARKAFRRQLGFLPENVAFHEELTGADTLAFYARLKGFSARDCPAARRSPPLDGHRRDPPDRHVRRSDRLWEDRSAPRRHGRRGHVPTFALKNCAFDLDARGVLAQLHAYRLGKWIGKASKRRKEVRGHTE